MDHGPPVRRVIHTAQALVDAVVEIPHLPVRGGHLAALHATAGGVGSPGSRVVEGVQGGDDVLGDGESLGVQSVTEHARLLHETRLLPVYYVPRADVRFDLLEPTDRSTHCPFKGDARYWTIRSHGILHGTETLVLQDSDGQISDSWSISAGLDYPAVGPEHAFLKDSGRAQYVGVEDDDALAAFQSLARTEGIIPALEPAHALAHVAKIAPALPPEHLIVMNMCGRGDKDIFTVARHLGVQIDA